MPASSDGSEAFRFFLTIEVRSRTCFGAELELVAPLRSRSSSRATASGAEICPKPSGDVFNSSIYGTPMSNIDTIVC